MHKIFSSLKLNYNSTGFMKIGKWKDLDNQCSGRDLNSSNNIDFI